MKKFLNAAVGLVLFAVIGVQWASAAEFVSPASREERTVTIASSETHKNLYTAGATVIVNGKTAGDLYVAGGSVDVTNDVEQDLVAAGGTVTVDGMVGGDVRMTGGTLKINGPVGGDVLVFGGTIFITGKSSVGGDLIAMGGTIVVDAPVNGSVRASGDSITINSNVAGTVTIGQARADQELVFGSAAALGSSLVIYGPQRNIVKKDGAHIPEPEYRLGGRMHERRGLGGFFLGAAVIKLLAMFAALLLLLKLAPRRAQAGIEAAVARPWSNMGVGLAFLIVTPIIAVLSFVVVVGYYIGLLVLALYFLALLIAGLLAALCIGAWIIKVLTKKPMVADWQAALLGSFVLVAVSWIPVIGWLACAVIFLMAFGTVLRTAKQRLHSEQ